MSEKKKEDGGDVDPAVRVMYALAPMSRCPFELFLWMQYSKEALTPGDDEAYCALFDQARATMHTDVIFRKIVTAVWDGCREGKSVKQINNEFLALVAAPEVEEPPSPPSTKRIEAGADIAESNNEVVDEQAEVKTEPPVEHVEPEQATTTSVAALNVTPTPITNVSGSTDDDDDLMKMEIGKRKDEQKWAEKRLNDREKLRQQLSKFDGESEKLKDLRWTVIVSVAFCQKTSRASCPPAELSAVTFDLHRGLIGRRSWHLRLIGTLADEKQQADMKSRRDNKKRGHFLSINAKDSRSDYDQVWRELIELTSDSQLILVHPEEEFDQTVAALKSLFRIANETAKNIPKLPSSKLVLLEDVLTVLSESPLDNKLNLLSVQCWTEKKERLVDGGGRWFCDYHRAVADANLYGCAAARAVCQLCGVMYVLRQKFQLPVEWFKASTLHKGSGDFGFLDELQKEDKMDTADAQQASEHGNTTDQNANSTSTLPKNIENRAASDVTETPPMTMNMKVERPKSCPGALATNSSNLIGFGRGRPIKR